MLSSHQRSYEDPPPAAVPPTDARRQAALHRSPVACLGCRQAKHKCDGVPPPHLQPDYDISLPSLQDHSSLPEGLACSRCSSQGLDCTWVPKVKSGRTKKRASPAEATSLESGKRPRSIKARGAEQASDTSKHGQPMADGSSATLSSNSSATATAEPSYQFDHAQHPTIPGIGSFKSFESSRRSGRKSGPKASYVPPSQLRPSTRQSFESRGDLVFSSPVSVGEPVILSARPMNSSVPFYKDLSTHSAIRSGIEGYFVKAKHFCLGFPSGHKTELYRALTRSAEDIALVPLDYLTSEARDLLTLAQSMAAVGWRLVDEARALWISDSLLQEARKGMQEIIKRPSEGSTATALTRSLPALIFGATLEYGLDKVDTASRLLDKAVSLTQEVGMEQLAADSDLHQLVRQVAVTQALFQIATYGDPSRCLLFDSASKAWQVNVLPLTALSTKEEQATSLLLSTIALATTLPQDVQALVHLVRAAIQELQSRLQGTEAMATSGESQHSSLPVDLMIQSSLLQLARISLVHSIEPPSANIDAMVKAADAIVTLTRSAAEATRQHTNKDLSFPGLAHQSPFLHWALVAASHGYAISDSFWRSQSTATSHVKPNQDVKPSELPSATSSPNIYLPSKDQVDLTKVGSSSNGGQVQVQASNTYLGPSREMLQKLSQAHTDLLGTSQSWPVAGRLCLEISMSEGMIEAKTLLAEMRNGSSTD